MATCAEIITDELKHLGVRHFFLLTGGDHALWVSFKRAGIHQVLARSEHAAVYMADAYARLTQEPACVYGQYGPGAANVAGSLAEPWWSSSPVVALLSTMRRPHRYRFEYQELDQLPLFAPVTKWQAEAAIPAQIPHLIRAGLLRSVTGNPGPVYIGIPNDLTGAPYDGEDPAPSRRALPRSLRFPLHRPKAPAETVALAARLLARAARPVILAGNGVHASGAYAELLTLIERLGAPLVTSLAGKGAIPEDHPLAMGTVGRYSRTYANRCMQDADVILAVGSRLGGLVTDSYRLVGPECTVIHADIDPEAIGHNFSTAIGAQADARTFLEDLLAALDSARELDRHRDDRARWAGQALEEKAAWQRRFAEVASRDGMPMRPEALVQALQDVMPPEGLLLADTGYAAAWVGALYEVRTAGRGFVRSDGSLGWAFPASLGAKLAAPSRPIVAVTGDGGFGYHVGELETAVRLRLPVIVIVLNNSSLAFEYHIQKLLYGDPVFEVDDFADVDHGAVARAFGADGVRVRTPAEFRQAFGRALAAGRPVVIDAIIDKDAIAPVTRYDAIREREL
ncbi:MAG: thiamine pyrophosphate-binding protein [Armatimonadota bacterium]|nr:thiamine pyrophosphate-binding protein [Armatimonadota bacterium]